MEPNLESVRKAEVLWSGDLTSGKGRIHTRSTSVLVDQPVTWASRTQPPGNETSPEELLAAAHASCYAMSLAHLLHQANVRGVSLRAMAAVTFTGSGSGFSITKSELTVYGTSPGLDQGAFEQFAQKAKAECPVSRAMSGVAISVKAILC